MQGTSMAGLQRIKDEHLTCPICHQVFKQPITLSCLHHFCRECLVDFTKTIPDIIDQGCFLCAICRRLTSVPEPQKPVEEWPEQLHSGFFVQGLIDALEESTSTKISLESGTETERCGPCSEEGDMTLASKWCTDCEDALCSRCLRLHQRFESTRDHLLCDVTDMKTRGKPKPKCMKHPEKRVEFFCQDCGEAICSTCSTTVHRQCGTVTSLSGAVAYMKNALEIKSRQIELENKSTRNMMSRNKTQLEKLTVSLNTARSEMDNVRQKLLDTIFNKKSILENELEQIAAIDVVELGNIITVSGEHVEENTVKLKSIESVLSTGSDMDLCIEYVKSRKQDREGATTSSKSIVTNVTFTTEVGRIIEEIEKYGLGHIVTTTGQIDTRVSTTTASPQPPPTRPKSTSTTNLNIVVEALPSEIDKQSTFTPIIRDVKVIEKFRLKHTLDTKIPSDKREPDINDVVAFKLKGMEVIVVADHSNRNIKSFYKQGKKQRHSWLRLEDTPNNMTQVEENTLAVTVPLLQQIVIATVSPDLSYAETIATKKVYNGLVCIDPSTFVAGTNKCVDVIDRSGNIIQTIVKHPNGSRLFTSPYYMCKTPGGLIAVTDTGTKRIVYMSQQGEVNAIYSPSGNKRLHYPCGVSAGTQFVFVADSGGRKVIQLTVCGEFLKDVLTADDGLLSPDGIFAVDDKKLCVGDKRYVKTFKLS